MYMKNLMSVILIFVLFMADAAGQQRIHVSVNGDDSNTGTLNAPLRSVRCALEKARSLPGQDTVFISFAPGTYFLE